MKTALVTTTVHVPENLRLLRAIDPSVRFFIAGDKKSPHAAIEALCAELENAVYIPPALQVHWKCSDLIGWNCIQRRNIATLEALKWGAHRIYSWDTDNLPIDRSHFDNVGYGFRGSDYSCRDYDGLQIGASNGWFDPGQLLSPPAKQRGFPYDKKSSWSVSAVTNVMVGVVAGGCLGDPDVDAVTRIAGQPDVHHVSELLRGGIVVHPDTWTIFNSQNTAFVRDLAPAMFMLPYVGRYDDIFASLICQRVMRDFGYQVFHGRPFTWQQRNQHCLISDLRQEVPWMNRIAPFARFLSETKLPNTSVLDCMRELCRRQFMAQPVVDATVAWCDDCEQAMTELPL